MKKTTGLIAAPPTAFRGDGTVDMAAVAPLAEHLQRQGVAGVFINGTTGEGMSLTVAEREQLAAEWRRALPRGLKLFVHVGHNCGEDAAALARHAQKIGADAVGSLAPGFFKPGGIPALTDWCAPVAAAAPDLPFYFYHMPSMNGVHLNIARFLEYARPRIPTLAGIKYTFETMGDYLDALSFADGRYDVLWGRDEMLLGALALGARGAVGSTYNIAGPLFRKLMAAFDRGDLAAARALQLQAVRFINVMVQGPNFFAVLKAVLQAQGVPITTITRSPLPPFSGETAADLARRCVEVIGGNNESDGSV